MRLSFFLEDVYAGKPVNIKKRYLNDNTLQKYVELCYSDIRSKITTLPEYHQDGAPLAYMPSNLEKQFRRVARVMQEGGVELPIEKAERMLSQICESIGEPENTFLQEVLAGEISFLPKRLKEQYDRGEHNAI